MTAPNAGMTRQLALALEHALLYQGAYVYVQTMAPALYDAVQQTITEAGGIYIPERRAFMFPGQDARTHLLSVSGVR